MIYTTGLDLYNPDTLAETLAELGAEAPIMVIDTRSSRFSRIPGFKNDFTAGRNPAVGYRWDSRIGGHPDLAGLYDDFGRIDYDKLLEQPSFTQGINQIVEDHDRVGNVLLVCACGGADGCHRARAVGRALVERGLEPVELDGKSVREILEAIPESDRRYSASPIPVKWRHPIAKLLDKGREPKIVARSAAAPAQAQATTRPQAAEASRWQDRLSERYAQSPTRDSYNGAIVVTTLASDDAATRLQEHRPSFIVDLRGAGGLQEFGDAQIIRPNMRPAQVMELLREVHALRNGARPIAIIVPDEQHADMAAAITNAGAFLAGLGADVRVIDAAGKLRSYADALRLSTKREAESPAINGIGLSAADAQRETATNLASIGPNTDGVNHINVYSNGRTQLGRNLSNFAHTPFTCADGTFQSVEGYWYWLGLDAAHPRREELRNAYGIAAKKLGQELRAPDWHNDQRFEEKIRAALDAKLEQHPDIAQALATSALPLRHYYIFDHAIHEETKGQWILDHFDSRRRELAEHFKQQPGRGTDEYADIIAQARSNPPRDARFATFDTYTIGQAAIIGSNRDPLGSLLPGTVRRFDAPAKNGAIDARSATHLFTALMHPGEPDLQRSLLSAVRLPPIPRAASAEAQAARDLAKTHEVALLDYAMRVAIAQDAQAQELLRATGDVPIVVGSTRDALWAAVGAGEHFQGYNVTGKILTEIRTDLQRDPKALAHVQPPDIAGLRLLGTPLQAFQSRAQIAVTSEPYRSTLRDVRVYVGAGSSGGKRLEGDIPTAALELHRNHAKRLAYQDYQLRTGGAAGLDHAHLLGVIDFLNERYGAKWHENATGRAHAERLLDIWTPSDEHRARVQALHVPFHHFDEHDPRTQWAVAEALRIHPNPRALQRSEFSLRSHARNMIQFLGEDGKHPAEFVLVWDQITSDGFAKGGTRSVDVLAHKHGAPRFNSFIPEHRQQFEDYLTGIERGTLRFGDGKDAMGMLYIAPRSGPNFAGQTLQHMDPRATPLREANISQATMTGALLQDVDLTRAYAVNLHAPDVTIAGTARYANLYGAFLERAELSGDWRGASFQRATLTDGSLDGVFSGAVFGKAELGGAHIHGDLRTADFRGANLHGVEIRVDDLQMLRGLDLRGADVTGLMLPDGALERANELGIQVDDAQRDALARGAEVIVRT